jgi:signal transduction histidine kinase
MNASRLRRKNKSGENEEEDITEILNQADHCIQMIRKISTELRPTIIDDFGIIAALEWQAEEFERKTKIKTSFQANVKELNLPPDHTNTLFRIFQESLTNVARHSEARNVHSSLLLQHESVILKIADDGNGFDTSILKTKKTLGLLGMKERINLINGSFEITSTAGKGTEITVQFPLPEKKN